MNILSEIAEFKKKEVEERKGLYPVKLLEKSIHFNAPVVSLKKYLLRDDKSGIIAEIKRKSPSRGMINRYVSVERTSVGYMMAGASALSILTDEKYFAGSNADLSTARKFNFCPILRKDFIIDEYQVIEAKSIGADAILLIAAMLSPSETGRLAGLARSLGLEVLLEIHNMDELSSHVTGDDYLVGINNRDLKTFEVNIETSLRLGSELPQDVIKISESGINSPEAIIKLKSIGFAGFLIGEYFMLHSRPEKACDEFIRDLERLEKIHTVKNEKPDA
ncbi:MAG TPA: indole-3-glycerol phosphate synthase TrpC [Cyclobacteriaceae bacterium]|nr:indole-3-glycerol phosphate synthase TrpC [Cyclobacteriaceae bacterium]